MKHCRSLLKNIIVMAALSLVMSASAKMQGILITSLPFTITAPGTYVLASDLSFTSVAGISVSTNIPGDVILDLKGHTITGDALGSVGIGIGYFAGVSAANNYPNAFLLENSQNRGGKPRRKQVAATRWSLISRVDTGSAPTERSVCMFCSWRLFDFPFRHSQN